MSLLRIANFGAGEGAAIRIVLLLIGALCVLSVRWAGFCCHTAEPVSPAPAAGAAPAVTEEQPKKHRHKRAEPTTAAQSGVAAEPASAATPALGEKAQELTKFKQEEVQKNGYERWKMGLPFWWRKAVIFSELAVYICIGVILGQIIEVAGLVRYIAVIAWPFLWLGRLPKVAGAPFVMAFQSGAVANTMLVAARDEGEMSKRQLYTSVLVVSCLSLFVHLPTFVPALAMAFGAEAAAVFFGVRFAAILAEILCVLLVSNLLIRRYSGDSLAAPVVAGENSPPAETDNFNASAPDALVAPAETVAPAAPVALAAAVASSGVGNAPVAMRLKGAILSRSDKYGNRQTVDGFFAKVWHRSRRTLVRLLIFVIPTFVVMSGLEYAGVFDWLQKPLDSLSCSWLPAQTPAIIAAQAVSLYNGAITAGSFVDSGGLNTHQAVVILLFGSLVTAPFRTLKHALPTYAAVLGMRPGTVMAVSAQLLRVLFLGAAVALLAWFWL